MAAQEESNEMAAQEESPAQRVLDDVDEPKVSLPIELKFETVTTQCITITTRTTCDDAETYEIMRQAVFAAVTETFKNEDTLRKITRTGDDAPVPWTSTNVLTRAYQETNKLMAKVYVTYTAPQPTYFTKTPIITALKANALATTLISFAQVGIKKEAEDRMPV